MPYDEMPWSPDSEAAAKLYYEKKQKDLYEQQRFLAHGSRAEIEHQIAGLEQQRLSLARQIELLKQKLEQAV